MPIIAMLAPEYLHSLPAPNAPLRPHDGPNPPDGPAPPHPLEPPNATDTHAGTWVPTIPASSPMHPWHPLTVPNPWHPPRSPWCHLYLYWPLSPYTPCQPPMHPWHPLMSLHPLGVSQYPLMLLITLLAPEHLHSLPAPNAPLHSLMDPPCLLTPLGAPQCPLMLPIPLLAPKGIHCLPASQCTPCQPLLV